MNVLMGIGNTLHGDDGIGPWIARQLRHENWKPIDCGTVPENFTGVIKQLSPHLLVMVDAAHMDLLPGSIRRIPPSRIGTLQVTTHVLPLTFLITHLMGHAKEILLIGIQPKKLEGHLSREIRNAGKLLLDLLYREDLATIPPL